MRALKARKGRRQDIVKIEGDLNFQLKFCNKLTYIKRKSTETLI